MKRIVLITLLLLIATTIVAEDQIDYSYSELGVSVFTPGGLNVMYGYSTGDVTYRAVGMYLDNTYGFQFEANYNMDNSTSYKHGPGFVLGYIDAADTEGYFSYTTNEAGVRGVIVGGHYFWNYHLFYISVGGAFTLINPNTDPPFAFLFNIGINNRFF